jgi:hypothetical protein
VSDITASAERATDNVILPLREAHGRYRDFRGATGPADPHVQAALRALLERSRYQITGLAEIAGWIYHTRLYVSAAEPGLAYVETDADRVPLDQPHLDPILPRCVGYVSDLRARCQVSDALTPDTRVPLRTAFVPPSFQVIESEQAEVISWERLRDYARVVIVGAPGGGKTSCLRRLALDITSGIPSYSDTLPIFIQLREFQVERFKVEDLKRLLDSYDLPDLEADLRAPLHGGRLLLMIDGLDELPSQEAQESFLSQLASLCQNLPCVRVILTSREEAYVDDLDGFTLLRLLPFDNQRIEQWALQYLASQDLAIPRHKFVDMLRCDSDLLDLARNPLLLALASSLHWKSPDELNDRAGLLRRCVEVLIEDWDAARGVARWRQSDITSRQIKTLVSYLAALMVTTQRDEFNAADVDAIFQETTEFHDSAPALLSACQTSGLVRGAGADRWRFTHRSFEDYFAACYLISLTDNVQTQISTYSAEEPERNFWAMSCALTSNADGLLSAAVDEKQRDTSGALAIMLAKALDYEISASKAVVNLCSRLIVSALERQLSRTELLTEPLAKSLQARHTGRYIAWAGGFVGDSLEGTDANFRDAAELLELVHRVRSGTAREHLLQRLQNSNLSAVRQVGDALKHEGWCTSEIKRNQDQVLLVVVVSRSAAWEAERLAEKVGEVTSAGPEGAGPKVSDS